uniref:G-protein coupled receptors family 1 profile domain-containing protein n=1 Tax=Panagrolaimus sp. ES5 TaxID=591445 RepID=A0AC34GI70_9BILA
MNAPEWLVDVMPAIGILGLATSACYLYVMYKSRLDAYVMYYGLAFIDVIFALSLIYAGFHGIIVMSKGDDTPNIRPIECLSQAIHVSIWYYCDAINLLIIVILCLDQMPILIIILISGLAILVPVWHNSVTNSNDLSVKVSSFCQMSEIVYSKIYIIAMEARRWVPLGGLAFLCITSIILLTLQLKYNWDFKWTDSNSNAQNMFFFVLLRCLLMIISVHLPLILFNARLAQPNKPEISQQNTNKIEYYIRFLQGISFGLIQPILSIVFLPKYSDAIKQFWNQYAHNTKRDWQSVGKFIKS